MQTQRLLWFEMVSGGVERVARMRRLQLRRRRTARDESTTPSLDHVTVAVRSAQLDDCEAIAAVQVAGWRAGYRGLIPDAYLDGLDVEEQSRKWAGFFTAPPDRRPRGRLLVAEDTDDTGGTVDGFVAFGPPLDSESARLTEGQLYAIYADPQRWGRGVGHALIEEATVQLRGIGARTALLWVVENNERAERFYRRHGWVLDGGRRDEEFDGVAVPLVRYVCSLGRAPSPG